MAERSPYGDAMDRWPGGGADPPPGGPACRRRRGASPGPDPRLAARGRPPCLRPPGGPSVQSVLAQLLLREAGLSSRQDPLVLTAAEVNAFLRTCADAGCSGLAGPGPDRAGWGRARRRHDPRRDSSRRLGSGLGRSCPVRSASTPSGSPRGAGSWCHPGAARSSRPTRRRSGVRGCRWRCCGEWWEAVRRPWCGGCRGSSTGSTSSQGDSSSTPGAGAGRVSPG